ncbi:ANTAR domain-containing protein [Streptomyces sp. NBC_00289]|uniref:ANTAR domain-containing protein n=1 Tax=Streptomyces sp. NBC_00289 TaxID=2975703 RepID=UPI003248DCDF
MAALAAAGIPVSLVGATSTVERVLHRVQAAGPHPTRRLEFLPSVEAAVSAAAVIAWDTSRAAEAERAEQAETVYAGWGGASAGAAVGAVGPGRSTAVSMDRPVHVDGTATATAAAGWPSSRAFRDVRRRARGWPIVAQAQGVLQGRYGLDGRAALSLLQHVSTRHNVKLRSLSAGLVAASPPAPGASRWFAGRARRPAPTLPFLRGRPPGKANTAEVVEALLPVALEAAGSRMGNVQLADTSTGDLWIEAQRNHSDVFLDFFDCVSAPGPAASPGSEDSACGLASSWGVPVTVLDVATDPVYDAPGRAAMLESGSAACHSVPMTTPNGDLIGVVSAHYPHRNAVNHVLGAERSHILHDVVDRAGAWLHWHRRTIILDALEDVHTGARKQEQAGH